MLRFKDIKYIFNKMISNIKYLFKFIRGYSTNLPATLDKSWIAPSSLKNVIMSDYYKTLNISKIKNKLMNGNEFESIIVNIIKRKFNNEYIDFKSMNARKITSYNKTLDCIKKGTPIIFQPILWNLKNKTFGCPDLIVRSDYINSLTIIPSLDSKKINAYTYCVVDIKSYILPFRGNNFIKNIDWMKYYKSQLYIYNEALGEMQNYKPDQAYIIGRISPFYKLGIIDYKYKDANYEQLVNKILNKI